LAGRDTSIPESVVGVKSGGRKSHKVLLEGRWKEHDPTGGGELWQPSSTKLVGGKSRTVAPNSRGVLGTNKSLVEGGGSQKKLRRQCGSSRDHRQGDWTGRPLKLGKED